MTTSNAGAVFFLGTRAHYQVLQPPDSISYDIENGNTSTETIYQNMSTDNLNSPISGDISNPGNILSNDWSKEYSSEMTLLDSDNGGNFELRTGITHRRKRRESSNEYILNDNDDVIDIDPSALNMYDRDSPKCKGARRCMNIRALLANLKVRRKNKSHCDQIKYIQNNTLSMCTYKDSCRCLDCQSRYFECDESEYSESDSDSSLPPLVTLEEPQQYEEIVEDEDDEDNDEVFIDSPPVPPPAAPVPVVPGVLEEDDEINVHMAAGTPVVLDYLLHHPFTCAIQ